MVPSLSPADFQLLQNKLDTLNKSMFAAGYHGLQNAGRTGLGALANDNVDDVLRSIAVEETDFLLTRDMPTIDMKSTVYQYRVKTAVNSSGLLDLSGTETFLPQMDAPQYVRVAEVAKIYGMKTSISHLATLLNGGGEAFSVDLEQELDKNASKSLGEQFERDGYYGGDYFMDGITGAIDFNIATANPVAARKMRGIQANVREGNRSIRGIPGDFIGFGANKGVVFNRKGQVMERGFLDKVATAINDNGGAVGEAHGTASQVRAFRATFFPMERAMVNEQYAIRGPAVTNDDRRGYEVDTCCGPMKFISTRWKYQNIIPVAVSGSAGPAPATPAVASPALTGSAVNSGFLAGQVLYYRVQTCGITGNSAASASQSITITTANYGVDLTITNVASTTSPTEYYKIFRTDVDTAVAGKEMFIGCIARSNGSTTVFRDAGRLIPGLNSVTFLPKDKKRAQMGRIGGSLVHKMQLGLQGLGQEFAYASYVCIIVDTPRACSVVDNVYEDRVTIDPDEAE